MRDSLPPKAQMGYFIPCKGQIPIKLQFFNNVMNNFAHGVVMIMLERSFPNRIHVRAGHQNNLEDIMN